MNNIKGIIFDLDHTLFNRYASFEALQDVFYAALKKYLSENITPRDIYIALKNGDKQYLYYGWDKIAQYFFGLNFFNRNIWSEVIIIDFGNIGNFLFIFFMFITRFHCILSVINFSFLN